MTRWTITAAEDADLPAILAIYNDVIEHTTAIYTDTPATLEERAAWLAERRRQGLPVLVARGGDGAVGGYGSFGPFRPWPGYATTVEHSVYVAADARRQGLGRLLVTALLECARERGIHAVIGGIDADNEPSLALHRELGFTPAGHLHRVARKFGAWVDLVLVEKHLGAPTVALCADAHRPVPRAAE
jgi:L-amino acid N-acyltransferase